MIDPKRKIYYVSANKASKITGISYRVILSHIRAELLPAVRSGGHYDIDLDDLEAYAYQMYAIRRYSMYNPVEFSRRASIYVNNKWE